MDAGIKPVYLCIVFTLSIVSTGVYNCILQKYPRVQKNTKFFYTHLCLHSKKTGTNSHKEELTMICLYLFSICMATSHREEEKISVPENNISVSSSLAAPKACQSLQPQAK